MPDPEDYFELFGLPRSYPIDRGALEGAYERLTLEHHPDFFATAPEAERLEAERKSAAINKAYRVLSHDVRRADYLLGLLAVGRPPDSKKLPPGFLQEMFLLSEEVEEISAVGDPEQVAGCRAGIAGRAEQAAQERIALFDQAANAADRAPGPATDTLLEQISEHLNCERYLQRLLNTLDGKSQEHELD